MKARLTLTMLLVCSLFNFNISFAQTEIEKYKEPKLIEGSNLYISSSPLLFNYFKTDSSNNKTAHTNIGASYVKWRFTRNFLYSADVGLRGAWHWNSWEEPNHSYSYSSTDANIRLNGGLSWYPYKNLLYFGFYTNSSSVFEHHFKPYSDNNIYGFIGTGKLLNAGKIMYAENFGKVLLDEGIITKRLPPRVMRKFTILLDKRSGSEFASKYHDDAEVEFFSQLEKTLLDEKIIQAPLGARAILKIAQALSNSSFIYFPRYKGLQVQAELGFSNQNYRVEYEKSNTVRIILSGVYGLPLGMKTNIVFSCFAGIPLNDEHHSLLEYPFFHSPLIFRDNSTSFYPSVINPVDTETYSLTGGIKILANYNISSFAGISAFTNLSYGKTEDKKNNFDLTTLVELKYNILSRLTTTADFYTERNQSGDLFIGTFFDIRYIVF